MNRENLTGEAKEPLLGRLLRVAGARSRSFVSYRRGNFVRVRERAAVDNIYHCCAHKTASQWLRQILGDPLTYSYSGLRPYHYQSHLRGAVDTRSIGDRRFADPFPQRSIVSPLYIDYAGFATLPKPQRWRAFFVCRDPRDIVVSWYFSIRYSHRPMGNLLATRRVLERESEERGLLHVIDYLDEFGCFDALRSWAAAPPAPSILTVKFEDLVGEGSRPVFRRLLDHLDIRMPRRVLTSLLDKHSFERLSGRPRGVEDRHSHYRRGTSGDWRNHFTPRTDHRFYDVSGDLLAALGYDESPELGGEDDRRLGTERKEMS